jgi:hypothetical protein
MVVPEPSDRAYVERVRNEIAEARKGSAELIAASTTPRDARAERDPVES